MTNETAQHKYTHRQQYRGDQILNTKCRATIFSSTSASRVQVWCRPHILKLSALTREAGLGLLDDDDSLP